MTIEPGQTITEVAALAKSDPGVMAQLKSDPVSVLEGLSMPLQTDVWIYRCVVGSLGTAVVLSILGALVLAFMQRPTPEVVTALGSAAIGALAGLLVPSPARH